MVPLKAFFKAVGKFALPSPFVKKVGGVQVGDVDIEVGVG